MSEFSAAPREPDLGDPALDPPMTVRVERWADRKRTDVRRAVKTDDADDHPWVVVVNDDGPLTGSRFIGKDDVRTWPVCPDVVTQTAYALAAGATTTEHGERGLAHLLDGPLAGRRIELVPPFDEVLHPDVPTDVLVALVGDELPRYRLHRVRRDNGGTLVAEYVHAEQRHERGDMGVEAFGG